MWESIGRLLTTLPLTRSCLRVFWTILTKFFLAQYKALLFSKNCKITNVDHPLDDSIPFDPSWSGVYMDFSPFWFRTQSFLLKDFGKRAIPFVKEFINSIANLYDYATLVYKNNFSTTKRPPSKDKIVRVIHTLDPHLMCIPSLHVMVVVWTYIKLRVTLRALGTEAQYEHELRSLRLRAIEITESILYVKQHSINCIAAALYALNCIDPVLIQEDEILQFIDDLFLSASDIDESALQKIKTYIRELYLSFSVSYKTAKAHDLKAEVKWEQFLLDFLENYNKGAQSTGAESTG